MTTNLTYLITYLLIIYLLLSFNDEIQFVYSTPVSAYKSDVGLR